MTLKCIELNLSFSLFYQIKMRQSDSDKSFTMNKDLPYTYRYYSIISVDTTTRRKHKNITGPNSDSHYRELTSRDRARSKIRSRHVATYYWSQVIVNVNVRYPPARD